jgi:hypothetical protein
METWDLVWAKLAHDGAVDSVGSAEYRRTTAAWQRTGCPGDMTGFIADHVDWRGASLAARWGYSPSN